jgi:hypothetical protein
VNEGGSGNTRRAFATLTDIGRVIFVRTCQWAMCETLAPYQRLGIIDVSLVGNQKVKLAWQGSAASSYKILAIDNLADTADPTNWQTIVQDISGLDGTVTRVLDVAAGPQCAFLRVAPMP